MSLPLASLPCYTYPYHPCFFLFDTAIPTMTKIRSMLVTSVSLGPAWTVSAWQVFVGGMQCLLFPQTDSSPRVVVVRRRGSNSSLSEPRVSPLTLRGSPGTPTSKCPAEWPAWPFLDMSGSDPTDPKRLWNILGFRKRSITLGEFP